MPTPHGKGKGKKIPGRRMSWIYRWTNERMNEGGKSGDRGRSYCGRGHNRSGKTLQLSRSQHEKRSDVFGDVKAKQAREPEDGVEESGR